MEINYHDYILSDPAILFGKPVIKGTRISVELILERLSSGETTDQLLKAYPSLTKTSINAALLFASQVLKADVIYPMAS